MANRFEPSPEFPMRPRNAYFLALKAQHDVQGALLKEARRSGDIQDEMLTETRKAREAQHAVAAQFEALRNAMPSSDDIATAFQPITRALVQLNASIVRFDRREADFVTALYAAVIDTTGEVVGRTNAGKWILASIARDPKTAVANLSDIAALYGDSNAKTQARQRFIELLLSSAADFPGLPSALSRDDLERFVSLAPSVLKAMNEAVPPDPAPGTSPIAPKAQS